jgi:predicted ABC-type ATPase
LQRIANADEIAKGLSPFQPEKAAIEAGGIMLDRINSNKFTVLDGNLWNKLIRYYDK